MDTSIPPSLTTSKAFHSFGVVGIPVKVVQNEYIQDWFNGMYLRQFQLALAYHITLYLSW